VFAFHETLWRSSDSRGRRRPWDGWGHGCVWEVGVAVSGARMVVGVRCLSLDTPVRTRVLLCVCVRRLLLSRELLPDPSHKKGWHRTRSPGWGLLFTYTNPEVLGISQKADQTHLTQDPWDGGGGSELLPVKIDWIDNERWTESPFKKNYKY
jgi:hypothetical protein